MSKKLVGKLVEFKLPKFFVYGICTHSEGTQGEIVRMLKGVHHAQNKETGSTLCSGEHFTTIRFPLRYTHKEPEIQVVSDCNLSKADLIRPIFRSLGIAPAGEKPNGWWIVDGNDEKWVEALTIEMASYPDDGLHNLLAIQELYENDLFPESIELLSRGPLSFDPTKM
ncbi:hypothetical protein [uncultured Aliiroseovarius sp.]|uniref:hypothetical protein n=1 Tax=uncultured Aliiroseovarius sp. TaxID=1658783 RepID=UPI00261EE33C|nr:hypothetical protein [uncultured Aliiroseovarius sp.]